MRGSITLLLMQFALGVALATPPAPDVPAARFADPQRVAKLRQALPRIDAMMDAAMKELSLPGLAYAVVFDDGSVHARGLGLADVAAATPAADDTVFRIASMTKSFTALAILKLRDAGRLNLDDPVARHVPELRGWLPPTRDSGPVTLRQLLAHTAGLPEDNPQGDRTLALPPPELLRRLMAGLPWSTAPGSSFEYSNLGYIILGQVITRVSGQPFQDHIRQQILQPLGMSQTHWRAATVPAGKLAMGHRKAGTGWAAEPLLDDGAGAAMGGLMSSAQDLARYVAALLAAYPPRDDAEAPPAPRRTLREMQAGQGHPWLSVRRRVPGAALDGRGGSYGFGLDSLHTCDWGREVEHSGGLPGFGSDMRWLPDHGVGVVVLANLTYAWAGRLTRDALALLDATGALQARQAQPSAALREAAAAVARLVDNWSDEQAQDLAAENLFLDEALADRRQAVADLRSGLGQCRAAGLKAENALRGQLRIDCDAGALDATLTLAPTQPPRVQQLDFTGSRPPSAALRQGTADVLEALRSGSQRLRPAASVDRFALAAALESARATYGACTLGALVESDGSRHARHALACERGMAQLGIRLDAAGLLSNVTLRPPRDAVCVR